MTIKEDDYLVRKFGRERHFVVPEGYFAQFNADMMAQITGDKAQVVTMKPRSVWRTVISVAACLIAAVVMTGAYFHADNLVAGVSSASNVAQVRTSNDAIEQAADYMMLDESDLYAYMQDY